MIESQIIPDDFLHNIMADVALVSDHPSQQHNGRGKPGSLPFLDMSTWDSTATPARQWYVLDHIPSRQPTLISGEGAIGKSILLLQLLCGTALSKPWIGTLSPKPGPTIYLGAEDEQDEIRRRLAAILDHHDAKFSDLVANGFKALAYAGKDAVLAEFDRSGRIRPTTLFGDLYAEAVALRPSAVVIDTVSDVFLGDEIKRDQVRQFGSLMRKLAIDADTATILSSHPSQSGMKSGSGLSGSTQWHNTVRARAYFRKPTGEDEEGNGDETKPDDGRRELHFLKNQFGPLGHRIALRWSNGLWLPPASPSDDAKAAAAEQMDELFLGLLRRFAEQGGTSPSSKARPSHRPGLPNSRKPRRPKHRARPWPLRWSGCSQPARSRSSPKARHRAESANWWRPHDPLFKQPLQTAFKQVRTASNRCCPHTLMYPSFGLKGSRSV